MLDMTGFAASAHPAFPSPPAARSPNSPRDCRMRILSSYTVVYTVVYMALGRCASRVTFILACPPRAICIANHIPVCEDNTGACALREKIVSCAAKVDSPVPFSPFCGGSATPEGISQFSQSCYTRKIKVYCALHAEILRSPVQ